MASVSPNFSRTRRHKSKNQILRVPDGAGEKRRRKFCARITGLGPSGLSPARKRRSWMGQDQHHQGCWDDRDLHSPRQGSSLSDQVRRKHCQAGKPRRTSQARWQAGLIPDGTGEVERETVRSPKRLDKSHSSVIFNTFGRAKIRRRPIVVTPGLY